MKCAYFCFAISWARPVAGPEHGKDEIGRYGVHIEF
jgi:hypothetical protein